jgi:hypothetical protein
MGDTHVFDSFECAIHALAPSAHGSDRWSRNGGWRSILLLCPLRQRVWRFSVERPC